MVGSSVFKGRAAAVDACSSLIIIAVSSHLPRCAAGPSAPSTPPPPTPPPPLPVEKQEEAGINKIKDVMTAHAAAHTDHRGR